MENLVQHYVLNQAGTSLVLLPSKLVWWPSHRTLFMADSHFGKASTFRKAGIAVPMGTTASMLELLSRNIQAFSAKRLIVLGDFLHSTVRAQQDFEAELRQWRSENSELDLVLVKGNHDMRAHQFYERLNIVIPDQKRIEVGPFDLCHDPSDARSTRYSLSGHLHPAIQIGGTNLPCFWLRKKQLVLPAFGKFTGTMRVQLKPDEIAMAVCENELAIISKGVH